VLGPAGLATIAPAGGPVAAVVVVPGAAAGAVRLVVANLAPEDLAVESPAGVEIEWRDALAPRG
jgi:hypothetical protein